MNEVWRDWRGAETETTPIHRTVIPQFTLRWLLGLTVVCACLLSVVAWGMRGHAWAVGVSTVLGAAVLAMLVQGSVFFAVWCVSLVVRPGRRGRAQSPFVSAPDSAGVPVEGPIDAILIEEDTGDDEVSKEAIRGAEP